MVPRGTVTAVNFIDNSAIIFSLPRSDHITAVNCIDNSKIYFFRATLSRFIFSCFLLFINFNSIKSAADKYLLNNLSSQQERWEARFAIKKWIFLGGYHLLVYTKAQVSPSVQISLPGMFSLVKLFAKFSCCFILLLNEAWFRGVCCFILLLAEVWVCDVPILNRCSKRCGCAMCLYSTSLSCFHKNEADHLPSFPSLFRYCSSPFLRLRERERHREVCSSFLLWLL